MVRRTSPKKEAVPPTLPPQRAIELLRQQIVGLNAIEQVKYDDPEIVRWERTTTNMLDATFGKPDGEVHSNTHEFAYCDSGESMHVNMTATEVQRHHQLRTRRRKALLESFIEQLELLAPPAAAVSPDQYRFHPEIERVSGHLYRDGHFKQAALEAYIRVIDEVKRKSGLNLDGDSLMNQAFGCEGRTPVIQFNDLQTDAEKDEQKGLMFWRKAVR